MDGRIRAGALVLYLGGLVVLTASTTAVYLAMRDVMAIGGSCASGGPYEIANPCPKGTGALMTGGIFGWFVGAGTAAVAGWRLPGSYGSLALLGWPALFLSLGWNFLDFGFDPAGGGGTDGSLVFCGVLFFLMGGVPLLFGLKALGRTLWPAATAARTPGSSGSPGSPGSWRLSDQIRAVTSRAPHIVVDVEPTPRPAPPPSSPPPPEDEGGDIASELERLADLHSRGALDDEEFERAKAIVLGAEEDRS